MLIAVVVVYFVVTILAGVYFTGRARSASDFLIAGRQLGLPLTTATLAAIQLGAGVVIGGAELGAESGIWPGVWYGLGCGGGLILAGLLVAAKLRRLGGIVPLDFFGERYGEMRGVRIWGWVSNIPSLLGIFVAQIMAAGSIFRVFGFDYTTGVIVCGIVIMLYSVMGGMWAVAATNLIQVGIIVIGIPLVAVMALLELGEILHQQLDPVEMGRHELRIRLDRPLELVKRLVDLALVPEDLAAAVVRLGAFRMRAQGLVQPGKRLLRAATVGRFHRLVQTIPVPIIALHGSPEKGSRGPAPG